MNNPHHPSVYDIVQHVSYVIHTTQQDSKPSALSLEGRVAVQAHMNCHHQLTEEFGMVSNMSDENYKHYVLIKELTAMFIHRVFGTKWIKTHNVYIQDCKKYSIDLCSLLKQSEYIRDKYSIQSSIIVVEPESSPT